MNLEKQEREPGGEPPGSRSPPRTEIGVRRGPAGMAAAPGEGGRCHQQVAAASQGGRLLLVPSGGHLPGGAPAPARRSDAALGRPAHRRAVRQRSSCARRRAHREWDERDGADITWGGGVGGGSGQKRAPRYTGPPYLGARSFLGERAPPYSTPPIWTIGRPNEVFYPRMKNRIWDPGN